MAVLRLHSVSNQLCSFNVKFSFIDCNQWYFQRKWNEKTKSHEIFTMFTHGYQNYKKQSFMFYSRNKLRQHFVYTSSYWASASLNDFLKSVSLSRENAWFRDLYHVLLAWIPRQRYLGYVFSPNNSFLYLSLEVSAIVILQLHFCDLLSNLARKNGMRSANVGLVLRLADSDISLLYLHKCCIVFNCNIKISLTLTAGGGRKPQKVICEEKSVRETDYIVIFLCFCMKYPK